MPRENDSFDIRLNPYRDPAPQGNAALGVTSAALGLLSGVGMIGCLGLVIVLVVGNPNGPPNNNDPAVGLAGLGILLCMAGSFAGLVLGFIGLFQGQRSLVLSVLGCVFNGIVFFGVLALLVVGLIVG
jgi:hypothetical protein